MGCGAGACVIADGDESDLSGRLSRGELRQCLVRLGLQQWHERPSLSGGKRRAQSGAAKCAERGGCCSAARKVHRLPQRADQSSRHPPLLGSDRASRRMLIALWENHHASGVALKVLATWAGAVNDSGPCANFYTCSKRRSSVTAEVLRKWRLSPILSPCSRPRSTWVVAGVAAVATPTSMPNEKIRTYTEMALRLIKVAGNY